MDLSPRDPEPGPQRTSKQDLLQLRWAAVAAGALFLAALEVGRLLIAPSLTLGVTSLVFYGAALVGLVVFSGALFRIVAQVRESLARRQQELLALHHAGLAITSELSIEAVLQKVVDTARDLVDARYGALAVYRDDGSIDQFITSGVTPEIRAAIGSPPVGKGLLGLVLEQGERLRLGHMNRHPSTVGFPPNHPAMESLLAVPVTGHGPYRGNLYLSEKQGSSAFTAEDEETLVRFATQAAIAVDNAYLHQRVGTLAVAEERLRIAHEMHDGLAQVLAYVNTKAQAVKEFLKREKTAEATEQLDQLASAARDIYGDVREAILGLRVTSLPQQPFAETLQVYVDNWASASGLEVRLELDRPLEVPEPLEIQVLRVVQEALGNVRKHARASRVEVEVRRFGQGIRVVVEDDGKGFDPAAPRRSEFPQFGLSTMRERAVSVGGRMDVLSRPGEGARVVLWFPDRGGASMARTRSTDFAHPDR